MFSVQYLLHYKHQNKSLQAIFRFKLVFPNEKITFLLFKIKCVFGLVL